MNDLLTVDEAIAHILGQISEVGVERVHLSDAVGRYLAETIEAPAASPPFDNSAMDGYAIIAADEGHRRVVGEAAAGAGYAGTVGSGEAVRIFTGAPVPKGADTVVMQEETERDGDTVRLTAEVTPGANIRFRGENISEGSIVLDVADRITAGDAAILASYNRSVFYTYRRPRVAILSTGDELTEVDRTPGNGQIVNSNGYMLEQLVNQAGGEPVVLPIARDTMNDTRRAFADALATCDMVVSAGGVSVGDHDCVGLVIQELGEDDSYFWKVRMKPGKPLAFARTTSGKPIIGLPGNPVSSFVGFHLFVAPAIRVACGVEASSASLPRVEAVVEETFGSTPKREHFVCGSVEWTTKGPRFKAFLHQSSGNLALLRGPTALAVVPVGTSEVSAGSKVEVVLLPAN